jgi:SHS2 domain-containing protein
MKYYSYKEHAADIIAVAGGDTLEEAFAAAAEAMFGVMVGEAVLDGKHVVTLEVESMDLEGLLVGFLSDLIVTFEVEGVVLTDFVVQFTGRTRLTATAKAEPFHSSKHGGTPVKGVSYHMLEIRESADGGPCTVQVLFDI